MPRRNKTDLEMEQQIFLGGQISGKHEEYMFLARMPPEIGREYWILKELDDILKEKNPLKLAERLLFIFGVTEGLRSSSELTRLSMILGDTRKRTRIGKDWKKNAKK